MVLVGAAINIQPVVEALQPSDPSSWWWAVVCIKVALFAALIAIACRNRFVLTSLLDARPKEASKDLLRNDIVDQGLAIVVLAVAAFMGVASPMG